MFGLFKSKKNESSQSPAEKVAAELFTQIERAKNEAKSGALVDEKVFNERLNSMFVAGYLTGYVDESLGPIAADDQERKALAEEIFNLMFPGVGVDFIKAKLVARKSVETLSPESEGYGRKVQLCGLFDKGMEIAQEEATKSGAEGEYTALRLKEFLLLGEI